MIEKTEKRAYAVVRVSSGGTRWLEYPGDPIDSLAPFKDGDEVEIRLRVAPEPQGPQALVVCDVSPGHAHPLNDLGDVHRCVNPRPAHPPAARTEPTLADLVAETRASIAAAAPVSAAPVGVCEKWNAVRPNLMGGARRCGLPLPCAKHPAAPVEPAPMMAQHDPPGSCAFTSSGVCVNHPAAVAVNFGNTPATPAEPEKLGEGPIAKAERRGCKIGGEP